MDQRPHVCVAKRSEPCLFCELIASILAGTGGFPAHEKKYYTPILFSLLRRFWPLQFWATNSDSHINDGFTSTKRTSEKTMFVSSARERSFEDRFAWLIRGEVGKKPILKKNGVLPARDASSFWLEKSGGPMLWACLAPQDPSLAGRSRSPFFDRPGRFIFVSQIEANFEIHEFINSGWPKWCPRGSPPKRPFMKKNVILLARDAC